MGVDIALIFVKNTWLNLGCSSLNALKNYLKFFSVSIQKI